MCIQNHWYTQEEEIKTVEAKCKGFPIFDEAFIHCLNQNWELNIDKEAYYGGTFTGNCAHRCMKVFSKKQNETALLKNIKFCRKKM